MITKKQLTTVTGLVTALFLQAQNFNNPLNIPPLISDDTFHLEMVDTLHEFNPGVFTQTYAFNGTYLGPTLEMQKWDTIQMYVTNHIGDSSSVHWHGLHVPAAADGGPHTLVYDNTTWSPSFRMLNNASTCWYHPHVHMNTMPQVNKGLAGLIIIRDSAESALTLPRTYGVDDFPIILQDRSFDGQGQFMFDALADSVVVNGTMRPYLNTPAQVVRMRVLNGANARSFIIAFSDNRPFYVIASDGGLIAAPDTVTSLHVTNGERYEILVDFTGDTPGDSLFLYCKGSALANLEPGGNGMQSGNSPLNGVDYNMLKLVITNPTPNAITTIPSALLPVTPWNPANSVRTRQKNLQGMGMYDMGNMNINGLTFDMEVINDTVYKDDIEIWRISNTMNISHPFHIHDIQFYVISRNGNPPAPYESGLKDVIYLKGGETVEFIGKFENFTDSVIPYMYHCHNLHHEDMGMMLQFIVIDKPTGIQSDDGTVSVTAYPNPSATSWTVPSSSWSGKEIAWEIIDMQGRTLSGGTHNGNGPLEIQAENFAQGTYVLRISGHDSVSEVKLLKQ